MALDGEDVPEYSLRPHGTAGKRKTPWLLILFLMAAAGGAGWLAWDQHQQNATLAQKTTGLESRAMAAENKQKDLQAQLDAAQKERDALGAAKDDLAKSVQSKDEELARLKGTYDQLQDKLKSELKAGDVSLSSDGGKLRVGLVDKVLFNSGEAQISKRGENVLMRVGAILAKIDDKQIQVSGHTDQQPIGEKRSAQFATNWELSVARATNVVRFLQEKASVPGERLVASGYGEFHPVASNKTSTGRARNRRIEILLTPLLEGKAIARAKLKADVAVNDAKPSRGKQTP